MSVRNDIIINLKTALAGITTANGYSVDIGRDANGVPLIFNRPLNQEEVDTLPTPNIAIIDGPDSFRGRLANYDRELANILLDVTIRPNAMPGGNVELSEIYNDLISDIRKCIEVADLGIYVNYLRVGDPVPIVDVDIIYLNIPIKILYHHTETSAPAPGTTTIYGSNTIIDQSRSAIKALLDELAAAMVTAGTSPRPLSVYDSHEQIKMTLPALTIGFEGESAQDEGGSVTDMISTANWSIRIHTDYEDGYLDEKALSQLINSIRNYIADNAHDDFSAAITGFMQIKLDSFKATIGESFKETLTIGGAIRFDIKTYNQYGA